MSTHNICFCGEIRKILCGYPHLSVATSLRADLFLIALFYWGFMSLPTIFQ